VSVTIYGRHDGDVIFEDDNGWASIPVRVLPVISYACIRREADGAAWAGRFFDRDVLLARPRSTCATPGRCALDTRKRTDPCPRP
jgi:hypothetical protein